jgi:hypothetical protein
MTAKKKPEFESFPSDWEESACVGSLKRNRDGSITVRIQIDVQGDGESYSTNREIRLKRDSGGVASKERS